MRPYWKGYLKLALVSCPIALHAACSTAERIAFRQINKVTGNRLRHQLIDEETRESVAPEHKGRGYEVAKGQYIPVEDEEIEKIRIASTHTIEITSFVKREEIDDRYIDSPYYIAPTDRVGQEAFTVIRDAIREKNMVALGRVVLTRREHVVMLEPFDKGILAATLRYAYEVRDAGPVFEDIPDLELPDEMKELAAHIVETKTEQFDPKKFEDHYENALVSLLRDKSAGRPVQAVEEAEAPRVINLMDALRASIKGEVKKPAAASTGARRTAKKRSAR